MNEVEAEFAATMLWTHDHPLAADVAKVLGLPVWMELDPMFYDLMRFCPQSVRRHAAVEYLPTRGEREGQPAARSKN